MIEKDLKEFGESMGIENLHLNDRNCLRLVIEQAGELYVEKYNEEVFFYLLKTYGEDILTVHFYTEALGMAYAQETYPFFIHPIACKENQIGFFTRLPEESCDLPTLNKVFNFLIQLIKTLEGNVSNSKN